MSTIYESQLLKKRDAGRGLVVFVNDIADERYPSTWR